MLLSVTGENVACVVIAVVLLILSALVSASETAFLSLSSGDIKNLKESKKPGNLRILQLLQEPEKLLAAMQVANVMIRVTMVALSAYIVFSMAASGELTAATIVFMAVIVIFVLLVAGEIAPRMYASQKALKILPRLSWLPAALQKAFYPFSVLLTLSTQAVSKQAQKRQSISIGDLSSALEKTSETSAENENILKGIVKFGNIDVHTIMTPRMDVESVDIATGLAELLARINEWGYSRIPVYDDAPDNVKGILYVKDLLPYIDEKDSFPWQKLIRNAYFVPEHKKIDDLLKEFQEKKMHLAVIIDEYGGMVGIVTLEDILEEIVGDIADESDDDEQDYIKIDEHTYLFDAKVLLNDFFRIMHLDESDFGQVRGEADTLAGLILEIKGEIPQKGDCIDYSRLSFFVESVDNRRIKQIKVVEASPPTPLQRREETPRFRKGDGGLTLLCLLLVITLFSCRQNYVPKPHSYFRIDFPEKEYRLYDSICPFTFEYPVYGSVAHRPESDCWLNMTFPEYKGTIYLTYSEINNNFDQFIEDNWKMIYSGIAQMADAVVPHEYVNPELNVYGTLYDIKGNAASSTLFFVTDSVRNFLRGSLYFYIKRPNQDSLAPVINFFREDIITLMESVRWKNKNEKLKIK